MLESSEKIIEKILSYNIFRKIDTRLLLEKYDYSSKIYAINSTIERPAAKFTQTEHIIANVPPEGIFISSPGTYTFAKNLVWRPANGPCSAITINSDNVVLNLNGHSLKAVIQDDSQYIVGINIANTENVSVLNGKLVDMCFYGVYATSAKNIHIENIKIDGLSFNNLNTRNLTPTGIHVNKSENISINSCTVQNIKVKSDSSAGVLIVESAKGTVSNCSLSHFTNLDGAIMGFGYLLSSGIHTLECKSSHFQSFFHGNILTTGHTVLGFCPIFCIDLQYENCQATHLTGCCDDCHGISIFLDAFITVSRFQAKNIKDGVSKSNSGAKATGLEVYGAEIKIADCEVENIISLKPQDKQSTGFSATGMLISFSNCVAQDVVIIDKYRKWNPDLGYGTGFGWAPDPRQEFCYLPALQITYENCKSIKCQAGFDTWYHIDSVWKNIVALDCGVNVLVEPYGLRTLSGNPCSECNPPIQVTLANLATGNKFFQSEK